MTEAKKTKIVPGEQLGADDVLKYSEAIKNLLQAAATTGDSYQDCAKDVAATAQHLAKMIDDDLGEEDVEADAPAS